MFAEETRDELIDTKDMSKIEVPPKKKRKYTKRKKNGPTAKTVKFKNEAEYIKYIQKFEEERLKSIVNGSAGPLVGTNPICFDSPNIFKKEAVEDKADEKRKIKAQKKAGGIKRDPITMVKIKCSKCGTIVEINSNAVGMYNPNPDNENDERPLFTCGCK